MMSNKRFFEILNEPIDNRLERFNKMSPDEVMDEHLRFITKMAYVEAETKMDLLGSARELGFLLLGLAVGMLIGLGW